MLQLRIVLCLLLIAIVAVSAITVKPLKEEGLQQSLVDVDGQGHENTGERLARQYHGYRGGYGRGGYGRGGYGRGGYGHGRYYG